jgi:hypothetical protein
MSESASSAARGLFFTQKSLSPCMTHMQTYIWKGDLIGRAFMEQQSPVGFVKQEHREGSMKNAVRMFLR